MKQKDVPVLKGDVTMINKIKYKLSSRTGASISFALLLFLVCAVLCSVILTAATASAGRMSGIAENDQRYYAVTSASELLKDMIGGKTVSIVKVTKSYSTVTYVNDVPGMPDQNKDDNEETQYLIAGKSGDEIIPADDFIDGNKIPNGPEKTGVVNDAAYKCFNKQTAEDRKLSMSSWLKNGDKDPLKVTITESIGSDGTIKLTVCNGSTDKEFKQELVFDLKVETGGSVKNEMMPAKNYTESGNDISYTVTTVTTETEIRSYTWSLASVKTLS